METLELKPGDPIWEADGPPRYVIADIWDRRVLLLRVDDPDEDYVHLLEEASRLRMLRKLTNQRKLDGRKQK